MEADRVRDCLAAAGRPGSPRWVRLALRLRHKIASLNARLRPFSGLVRTLSIATHRDRFPVGLRAIEADRVTEAWVTGYAERIVVASRRASADGDHLPRPNDAPTTAPVLRTGPPAPMVSAAA